MRSILGPFVDAGVAGGPEEFVVEDRAWEREEGDDPGDVPLPGVLVAEHVDGHRRGVFVEPRDRAVLASLGWEEEPGDRQPEGAGERGSSATSITRWRREVKVFSIAESPAAVIGRAECLGDGRAASSCVHPRSLRAWKTLWATTWWTVRASGAGLRAVASHDRTASAKCRPCQPSQCCAIMQIRSALGACDVG